MNGAKRVGVQLAWALGKLLNPSVSRRMSVCVQIFAETSPNTGAFTEPGAGRQRAMRSGLGRPTVTLVAWETTPVRARERRTEVCHQISMEGNGIHP